MRPEKLIISLDEAEAWAREHFALDAVASELPGDVDRNVLLTERSGIRWVLKLASMVTDRVDIECQHAVLRHLEATDLGDLVPRLVLDSKGAASIAVRTAAGDSGLLRLVTYLPGRPLAKIANPHGTLYREIGRTLGRLDVALSELDHPGARRHKVWDLVHFLDLEHLLDALDDDLRELVAAGLDSFACRVHPRLADLPTSIIHNDANDYNLLVDDSHGRTRLCGVIDFGDLVHTITVAEPAIACAYAMLDSEDPRAVSSELIAGYESVHPLSELEHELLPDLIIARLCTSLLMSAQARCIAPDDEYLRISERPASDLLKRLSP